MFKLLKSKFFLYIISLGILAAGTQTVYVSLKNPKATTISVRDYLKTKPDVHWVILTNARLNFSKAVYATGKLFTVKDVYVPVESSQADSPKSNLFIRTDISDVKKIIRLGKKQSRSKQESAELQEIMAKWNKVTSVAGLIQVGLDSDSDIESQIKTLSGLHSIHVLKLNASPLPWFVGLVLFALAFGLFNYTRKKKPAN